MEQKDLLKQILVVQQETNKLLEMVINLSQAQEITLSFPDVKEFCKDAKKEIKPLDVKEIKKIWNTSLSEVIKAEREKILEKVSSGELTSLKANPIRGHLTKINDKCFKVGIKTIGDILSLGERDLLKFSSIGSYQVGLIKEMIYNLGMSEYWDLTWKEVEDMIKDRNERSLKESK